MAPTREQINNMLLGEKKYLLPEGTQAHEVTTIDMNYYNNLNYKINRREIEAREVQNNIERDNKIRELSKSLWENWSNTAMSGELAQKKRLEQRKARQDQIENEKRKLDEEEAAFQAEKRKAAIDRARTIQYYQNDRIKSFHTSLMLTEVLKERDIQCGINKLRKVTDEEAELEHHRKMIKDYHESLEKEKEKQKKIREKNFEFSKFNYDKHKNRISLEELEKIKDKEMAELVKLRIAECDREDLEFKNAIIKFEREKRDQAIDDHNKMKAVLKIQDEEENDEIRMFAAGKKKMIKKVFAKQKELFDEKQKLLENTKSLIAESHEATLKQEEKFLEKSIKEGEEKFLANEEAKRLHNEKAQNEVNKHRVHTIKRHEENAVQAKLDDIEEGKRKKEAYEHYLKIEALKQKKMRERALSLVNYWEIQKGVIKKNRDRVNTFRGKHCQDLSRLDQIEKEIYDNYTDEIIGHCRKGERNVFPLLKEKKRKYY